MKKSLDDQPDAESYRTLLTREWADVHHSRVQEWSALGVVAGVHIGLIQLMSFGQKLAPKVPFRPIAITACVFGILFCIAGALVTCRHRRLMAVKLSWIYQAEQRLGLVKPEGDDTSQGIIEENRNLEVPPPWNGLTWPRRFSTSWLMILIYLLLMLLDLGGLTLSMSKLALI